MKEYGNTVNCSQFEELLSDYIEKTLEVSVHKSAAEHALACPLCHSLLNDVKDSVQACHQLATPKASLTRLEAKILERTTPEMALACEEFEGYLTDYLDGFLPANVFHRWERHAVMCNSCEDLPGMVVRSIAAVYSYKMEELAIPDGLHNRILVSTLGTTEARDLRPSIASQFGEWLRGLRFPIGIPQLAPVAAMILVAFMVFSQTVSADGTLSSVYQQGFELAESTYQQSADAWNGKSTDAIQPPNQEPIGAKPTFVDNEEKR